MLTRQSYLKYDRANLAFKFPINVVTDIWPFVPKNSESFAQFNFIYTQGDDRKKFKNREVGCILGQSFQKKASYN